MFEEHLNLFDGILPLKTGDAYNCYISKLIVYFYRVRILPNIVYTMIHFMDTLNNSNSSCKKTPKNSYSVEMDTVNYPHILGLALFTYYRCNKLIIWMPRNSLLTCSTVYIWTFNSMPDYEIWSVFRLIRLGCQQFR